VPADEGWRLDRFEVELDAWADREGVPPDLLHTKSVRCDNFGLQRP